MSPGKEDGCLGSADVHLDAGPEGVRGPVVPSVDDTCSHMLAFRGSLVRAGGLLDADIEVLVGSDKGSVLLHATLEAATEGCNSGSGLESPTLDG